MSAKYPTQIYSGRTRENLPGLSYDNTKPRVLFAEDIQAFDEEITAIETALGANLGNLPAVPTKATGAEIDTGTNDTKFVTPKAIEDSNLARTSDIPTVPTKATGAELDTGTDDNKFATAKALKDSHNVPSVVPGTSGNVLTSNGTDWTSATPAGGGAGSTLLTWISGQNGVFIGGVTTYFPVFDNSGSTISKYEVTSKILIGKAGTIKNLYVNCTYNNCAGNSVITVRKNGSDQTLTVTMAQSVLTASDTAHSFSVSAGDLVSIKIVTAGSAGNNFENPKASVELAFS